MVSMNQQINLRLPTDLRKSVEKYAKMHGYKSLQELAKDALRMKIYEDESMKETLNILKDKELMRHIEKSREDLKRGRVVSWEELQDRWKKQHAKK